MDHVFEMMSTDEDMGAPPPCRGPAALRVPDMDLVVNIAHGPEVREGHLSLIPITKLAVPRLSRAGRGALPASGRVPILCERPNRVKRLQSRLWVEGTYPHVSTTGFQGCAPPNCVGRCALGRAEGQGDCLQPQAVRTTRRRRRPLRLSPPAQSRSARRRYFVPFELLTENQARARRSLTLGDQLRCRAGRRERGLRLARGDSSVSPSYFVAR